MAMWPKIHPPLTKNSKDTELDEGSERLLKNGLSEKINKETKQISEMKSLVSQARIWGKPQQIDKLSQTDMVAHSCNPSTWVAVGRRGNKASLGSEWDHVSKSNRAGVDYIAQNTEFWGLKVRLMNHLPQTIIKIEQETLHTVQLKHSKRTKNREPSIKSLTKTEERKSQQELHRRTLQPRTLSCVRQQPAT